MAAVNIQIDVPNLGTFEMEELKHKLTVYARNLIDASNKSKAQPIPQQQSADEDFKYSARLNRLRRLCGRKISAQDIQEDEMDKLWEQGLWSQEKNEEILREHL